MLNEHRIHLDLYGIKNCDSCRHAQRWLKTRNVPFTFHDIRAEGLPKELLRSWLDTAHGPYLLNRRSTTWRQLSEAEKQAADRDPLPLLLDHPTLIKRPVITDGHTVLDIGFAPANLEDYI
jgi:Spx/MgsR family transcriptional regulator